MMPEQRSDSPRHNELQALTESRRELVEDLVVAVRDFAAQPLGVVGVLFVMSATTTINSEQIARWFEGRQVSILLPYNGLNLVGAVSLLANALLQQEFVWLLLEIYLIGIAVKGLLLARRLRDQEWSPSPITANGQSRRRTSRIPESSSIRD